MAVQVLAPLMAVAAVRVAGALGHIVKKRQTHHCLAVALQDIVLLWAMVVEQALTACAQGCTVRTILNRAAPNLIVVLVLDNPVTLVM